MDRITHCFTRRRKHPTEQSLRQNRSRTGIPWRCMDRPAFSGIEAITRDTPGRESTAVNRLARPAMEHPKLNGSRREPA
ncbi:MAG: hypothetical protein IT510_08490 [Sulfuritalea sp.]|jgi:hypothetical protein|nr:hypothetical protein [Sulfuritalea sp.]